MESTGRAHRSKRSWWALGLVVAVIAAAVWFVTTSEPARANEPLWSSDCASLPGIVTNAHWDQYFGSEVDYVRVVVDREKLESATGSHYEFQAEFKLLGQSDWTDNERCWQSAFGFPLLNKIKEEPLKGRDVKVDVPSGGVWRGGGKISPLSEIEFHVRPYGEQSWQKMAELDNNFFNCKGQCTRFEDGVIARLKHYAMHGVMGEHWRGEIRLRYPRGNGDHYPPWIAVGLEFYSWSSSAKGGTLRFVFVVGDENNQQFRINTASIPGSGGGISGGGTYVPGEQVSLHATANNGYRFTGWGGAVTGTSNPVTLTADGNRTVRAYFERIQRTLSTSSSPSNGGSVSLSPSGGTYDHGTSVNLHATPNSGYTFSHWTGHASGSSSSTTVTMNDNKSVTAHFQRIQYSLSTSSSPSNGGSVSGGGGYNSGQTATLTASPADGYTFSHWSGDASGSNRSTSVTMNRDKSVTAEFVRQYTLTTRVTPSSSGGSVSVNPSGGIYDQDRTVAVTASPSLGWRFVGWQGDASGSNGSITVTMNHNKTVTAEFILVHRLTTQVSPSEGGTVSLSPPGDTYDDQHYVQVTAHPNSGWRFVRWQGDLKGTATQKWITMNGSKSVTAVFERIPADRYTLSVSASGGSVSLNPPGGVYDDGQSVGLTATPDSGYRFVRWSGHASGSSSSTTVTMNGHKSVTAHFQQETQTTERYTLNVSASPSVGGSVSGDGIYDSGETVMLRASPSSGYTFSHWSGDASGSGSSTTVMMNRNRSVTAVFEAVEDDQPLTVSPFVETLSGGYITPAR